MKNLVIFGAPGAGKGTQSALLVSELGYKHISTGDLFRHAIKNKTSLGEKAKSYMDKGELVPDEIVIGMVEEVVSNLDSTPFILDGFPRTSLQAEELDILLKKLGKKVDLALFVDVPNEKIVERLSGRRICSSCGTAYHIKFKPPKNESVCDLCGSDLYQRKDDNVESINTRLDVYSEQTLPLREYYKTKSVFSAVNGDQDENAVFAQIKERL